MVTTDEEIAANEPEELAELFDLKGNPVVQFDVSEMVNADYQGPEWVGNFNPMLSEYIELAFRSNSKSDVDPDSEAAANFPLVFWCIQRHRRFQDEQGETVEQATLAMFTEQWASLIITSAPALRFFNMALGMRGVGPYDPPLPICCEKVPTALGRKMINLRIKSV